jgi:hypothetical protein
MSLPESRTRVVRARTAVAAAAADAWAPWAWWALFVSALALWAAAMAPRLEAQALFGPICSGHGSTFALHCPTCYVAAALAAAGIALAAQALARAR